MLVEKLKKYLVMSSFFEVEQFVDNDVLDAVERFFRQFQIEQNPLGIIVACSPTGLHFFICQTDTVTPSFFSHFATSAELSKVYSDNEVAADAKYKGKLIEVSGKVSGIDNGTFDNKMIVKLSDGQYDFNATQCSMRDSEKEKVLDMKKGQSVTLIGTGDSATLKSPILKDCIVK